MAWLFRPGDTCEALEQRRLGGSRASGPPPSQPACPSSGQWALGNNRRPCLPSAPDSGSDLSEQAHAPAATGALILAALPDSPRRWVEPENGVPRGASSCRMKTRAGIPARHATSGSGAPSWAPQSVAVGAHSGPALALRGHFAQVWAEEKSGSCCFLPDARTPATEGGRAPLPVFAAAAPCTRPCWAAGSPPEPILVTDSFYLSLRWGRAENRAAPPWALGPGFHPAPQGPGAWLQTKGRLTTEAGCREGT